MINLTDERTLGGTDSRFFQAMRLEACHLQPYMASAIFAMIPVVVPGKGTFAVDRKWRLYLDMEEAYSWGIEQAAAVLLHEAHHLLRNHHDRGAQQATSRNTALTWNVACDIAINDDLVSAGILLPQPILPSTFGLKSGGVEEQYYNRLRQLESEPGIYSCGSGSGGPMDPNEVDAEDAPGVDHVDAFAIRHEVRIAISNANPMTTIPGGLTRWASGAAEPVAPWRSLLRGSVRSEIRTVAGSLRSSWAKPHRRSDVHDVFLRPGHYRTGLRIAVVLDTSSSMTQHLLDAAATELAGLLATIRNRSITLITCDSEGHMPRELQQVGMISVQGGGSTDLRIGIASAAQLSPAPNLIVVLTDGETPWPAAAPDGTRMIAVVIGSSAALPVGSGITAVRVL